MSNGCANAKNRRADLRPFFVSGRCIYWCAILTTTSHLIPQQARHTPPPLCLAPPKKKLRNGLTNACPVSSSATPATHLCLSYPTLPPLSLRCLSKWTRRPPRPQHRASRPHPGLQATPAPRRRQPHTRLQLLPLGLRPCRLLMPPQKQEPRPRQRPMPGLPPRRQARRGKSRQEPRRRQQPQALLLRAPSPSRRPCSPSMCRRGAAAAS